MRPFDTQADLDRLADELGARDGPMVLFAAATGLRPGEWVALEHRDIGSVLVLTVTVAVTARLAARSQACARPYAHGAAGAADIGSGRGVRSGDPEGQVSGGARAWRAAAAA